MKYNLNNEIDKHKFKERCNQLLEEGSYIELRKINQNRSLPQNAYLHLILGWFAIEYGETIDYVKEEIFKKTANKLIFETDFVNRVTGEVRKGLRSTKSLDTKEMTNAIDKFRDYSSKEAGIYLPSPNERDFINQIEIEIGRQSKYL